MQHGSSDPQAPSTATGATPLAVDLDGTLVAGDVFLESFFALLYSAPLDALRCASSLAQGKAAFKRAVAERMPVNASTLPYRDSVRSLILERRAKGGTVELVTAADALHAEAIADYLGVFDAVLASDGKTNLSGAEKAAALTRLHPAGFDYVGNSTVDVEVWAKCQNAFAVAATDKTLSAAARRGVALREVEPRRPALASVFKLLRPRQWAKNLLLFVPLVMGHRFTDVGAVWTLCLAFVAFSLVASSTYVLNDLADVASDRRHPRKKHRPIAAGTVEAPEAIRVAVGLLVAAMVPALMVGWGFLGGVLAYAAATTAYSAKLKRVVFADVVCLASFYVYRVVLGGIAISTPVSHWLLIFCGFLFLSLALAKRYAELHGSVGRSDVNERRGYLHDDLPVLLAAGVSSSVAAVLIFALYVNGETASAMYSTPEYLWVAAPALLYWSVRVWFLASRGQLHDDPIVFAFNDRQSHWLLAALVATFGAATFL